MAESINAFFNTYGIRIITIAVSILIVWICLLIAKHFLKKSRVDKVMHKFIYNALKIVLLLIVVIMGLDSFGINTTSIVTVLGVGGAAIALALKDSLGNIAGGIIIAFTKPFKQGDYIEVEDKLGIVQEIDLLLTKIKTYDNKIITVPNRLMSESIVINHTSEDLRRVDLYFGIGYESDIEKAKDILRTMAKDYPLILNEPEAFVGVYENTASAVELEYRVWCKTEDFWTVKYYLMEEVKKVFEKYGIKIPYEQVDVHVK